MAGSRRISPDLARHYDWLLQKLLSRLRLEDFEPEEMRSLIAILEPVHGRVMNRVDAGLPVAGVKTLRVVKEQGAAK